MSAAPSLNVVSNFVSISTSRPGGQDSTSRLAINRVSAPQGLRSSTLSIVAMPDGTGQRAGAPATCRAFSRAIRASRVAAAATAKRRAMAPRGLSARRNCADVTAVGSVLAFTCPRAVRSLPPCAAA
jgi:hypothetical protein